MQDVMMCLLFGIMFTIGYVNGKAAGKREGYNRARSIFGAGK